MRSLPDTLVRPAHLWVPDHHRTLGPEAADLAALCGLELDDEQRLMLDALLSVRADGKWAGRSAATILSRQNGKTVVLQAAALADLFLFDVRLVIWTAHLFDTTQEAFRDIVAMVNNTPELSREVKAVHYGRGDEGIELTSGARLNFIARSKSGGRGMSGDVVVLDEAFALTPTEMGALLPTVSARRNPQVRYASSAGKRESAVLRGVRDRGREGGDPSLVYVEWCADGSFAEPGCADTNCDHALGTSGCALDDAARWAAANPSLGRRISVDAIEAERRELTSVEFARERLGWWDDPPVEGVEPVIEPAVWDALVDAKSAPLDPVTFGFDMNRDRTAAAVSVCGTRTDGRLHVGTIDHRKGTDWLVDRLEDLRDHHKPAGFVVDARSAAASLLPDLERIGIVPKVTSSQDMARACGTFYDLATQDRIRHVGAASLSNALKGAKKRELEGSWAWDRRKAGTDITPLVSATLALHGHVNSTSTGGWVVAI